MKGQHALDMSGVSRVAQPALQMSSFAPLAGDALIMLPGVGLVQDSDYGVPSEHGHNTKVLDYELGWGEGAQMPPMPKHPSCMEHDAGCSRLFCPRPNNIWENSRSWIVPVIL